MCTGKHLQHRSNSIACKMWKPYKSVRRDAQIAIYTSIETLQRIVSGLLISTATCINVPNVALSKMPNLKVSCTTHFMCKALAKLISGVRSQSSSYHAEGNIFRMGDKILFFDLCGSWLHAWIYSWKFIYLYTEYLCISLCIFYTRGKCILKL